MHPLVSVVIPVFNGESTIARALASLFAQTVVDWEAVVVDDGSTDRTAGVVKAMADPRIRLFRSMANRGRGAARQLALDNCRGRILAMLDADDWWYPRKLERQLAFLDENPDIGVVSSAMAGVDQAGRIRGVWGPKRLTRTVNLAPQLRSLAELSVPHAPSLVEMGLAKSVGYETRLRRSEDFVFLAKVLRRAPHAVIDDVLYAYTDTGSSGREDTFARYVWSARASLCLVREYRGGAAMRSGRSFVQAVLALMRIDTTPLSRSILREPKREEAEGFDSARSNVELTMQGLCS